MLLIALAEGLGAAKSYAAKEGYDIDTNAELVGLGAANIGAGLTSGMVVNGSLSKTAVNGGAGAKSQFSTITVSVLVVLTLLFLTGLFENLPEAVLAAVVIAAVIELVDFGALRRLYSVWTSSLGRIYSGAARADFIAATGALLGVLIFDTLPGLFIGITLSLIALLYRSSRPNIATLGLLAQTDEQVWVDVMRHPEAVLPEDALVLRVESGLYFANADHVRDEVRAHVTDATRIVVLDAETMPSIDVSGARMLALLKEDLARDGIELAVAKSVGQFRDVIRRAETADALPSTYETIGERSRPHADPASSDRRGAGDTPTPACLARYTARSAARSRVSGSCPTSRVSPIPIDTPTRLSASSRTKGSSKAVSTRTATSSGEIPVTSRIANSSPPRRATRSGPSTQAWSRHPTSTSTASPAACPQVSFTGLNPSRSRKRSAASPPLTRFLRIAAIKALRFGRRSGRQCGRPPGGELRHDASDLPAAGRCPAPSSAHRWRAGRPRRE